MNKYFILDRAQMDRLLKEGGGQEGGAFEPDITLSHLPKIQKIDSDIKKHLKKKGNKRGNSLLSEDPYTHYMQYAQMQKDLQRMQDWFRTRQAQNYLPLTPPTAPPEIHVRDAGKLDGSAKLLLKPHMAERRTRLSELALMDDNKQKKTSRRSRSATRIPILAKREGSFATPPHLKRRSSEFEDTPSPRRSRSRGPPTTWSTLDQLHAKKPRLKRV